MQVKRVSWSPQVIELSCQHTEIHLLAPKAQYKSKNKIVPRLRIAHL